MPNRGILVSNKALLILGVPLSVTVSGPPDKIIPLGFNSLILSISMSQGRMTEKTPTSLTLLAMS